MVKNCESIYGINPIYSLLTINSGRRKIYEIVLNKNRKVTGKVKEIISIAKKKKIKIIELKPDEFYSSDKKYKTIFTQGICAKVSPYNYYDLNQYLSDDINSDSCLVVLDGVTDIGNFGSIIRNCSAFGVDGIIISKNRSASVNERVSKISAGALEEVKVFSVVNIVRTLKELKKKGFWIYGTAVNKTPEIKSADEVDFIFPLVVVFGGEDKGLSRLVGENCDVMVTINLIGRMQSLNVSVASGILLYIIQKCRYKYR